jgi:hypothetical protein
LTQIELLRFAFTALERLQVLYAVVGSFATGVWGDPRMTRDIDIVVQLHPEHVRPILAAFPDAEFYVSRTAVEDAIRRSGQFNVIHPTSGNKIDFMVVGQTQWAVSQIARRRRVQFLPDCEGYVAAPDDVIIGKLVYYRDGGSDKHLRDVNGILKRSGEAVDREYVRRTAHGLGVDSIWQQALDQLNKP